MFSDSFDLFSSLFLEFKKIKITRAKVNKERIKEITENIVKQIPTLIDKKMDLFSSKVNQNLNHCNSE